MTLAFSPPAATDSVIARLDPRWRLAGLGIAGLTAALPRSVPVAAVTLAGCGLLVIAAQLPRRWVVRRAGGLAATVGPLVALLPLLQGVEGMRLALLIGLKASAVGCVALVLLGSAPLPVTLDAAHRLHAPARLTHVALLTYRYLFVLADEFSRLRRAVRARGFRAGANRYTYRTVGALVGTLIVRGLERSEQVGRAMRCRGFDGTYRSAADFTTRLPDVLFVGVVSASAAGLIAWELTTAAARG